MKQPGERRRAPDDPGHREAQEALPWLANRSLSGSELERVWAHVQACAECRADLATMHTWRHAMRAADGGAAPDVDAERALARVRGTPALPVPPWASPSEAPPARLVVVFQPDTPEREVRRIVRANGARIVGGPTAGDAYLLTTDGDLAPVLVRLHAEAAVTQAEPFARRSRP